MASTRDHGASSSSTPQWTYQVFLSFRGEDTRRTFLDHLYKDLQDQGIFTFKDDEEIRKGKEISPALLQAIEESWSAIIIFSKEYASSTWCLDELAKIIHRMEEKKIQKVIPVFYHVKPSEVRHQRGSFAVAFKNHERVFGENSVKVQRWRTALEKAANISGHSITANEYEAKCIRQIVGEILSDPDPPFSMVDNHLVGIVPRVEQVKSLLSIGSNNVRIIGIWGQGGIGKTTIAEFVFNQNSYRFEGRSYLENVREVSNKYGVQHLQKKLLSDILSRNVKISNVHDGINKIKGRLRNKRILVILDNVDHKDQIDNLAGSPDWFGLGSRIIITTRNKNLLRAYPAYDVPLLNKDEAIRLLSMNAFDKNRPFEGYEKVSNEVVRYAGGLPLALKVLGASLFGKGMTEWRSTVDKLKHIPNKGIVAILKISYDGLDDIEKEIFLDIACFFHGKNRDSVIRILDSFDFHTEIGISVLIERCLIIDSDGCLMMHDLIREMGQYIVCEGRRNEPEKWSRLWRLEDVRRVLEENTGSIEVEGMVLDLHEPEMVNLNAEAFKNMKKLRILVLRNIVIPSRDIEYLPNKLRWLDWQGYPSKSLPESFDAESLGGLIMCSSCIVQLWEGRKRLNKLKDINLCGSRKLTRIPDFTGVPKLKRLYLRFCDSLVEVHPSVGVLKELRVLDLSHCKSLEKLPSSIHLPSLEKLDLSSCSKLENFPEICGNMEKLSELQLSWTAIKDLPSSIEHLTNLPLIHLWDCKDLRTLPDGICMLKHLRSLFLSGCSRLEKLPENLGDMECLEELKADETALKELPSSIEHLTSLVSIDLRNCKSLTSLPQTICHLKCLKFLLLSGCSKLDNLPENLGGMECLEELHVDRTAITEPPPSIGHLKNLKFLSFRGIHNSVSAGLVLPSVSGLSLLTVLDLSGCNMFDGGLPRDLGNLSSLEGLDLSGNNFVKLPESINRLSRLQVLVLDGCKNLEALPKLPSNIAVLHADECHSLKSLGDLSTNDKLVIVSFTNCSKLLQNEHSCENITDMLRHCKHQALLDCHEGYSIFVLVPGTEIPQWFSHPNLESSISIQLPPRWFSKNLMGVALYFDCEFTVLGATTSVFRNWSPNEKINSKHLLLTSVSSQELQPRCLPCSVGPNELTLDVSVSKNESFCDSYCERSQLNKFGFHLVYKEDTDGDSSSWYDEPCQRCMEQDILEREHVDHIRNRWTEQDVHPMINHWTEQEDEDVVRRRQHDNRMRHRRYHEENCDDFTWRYRHPVYFLHVEVSKTQPNGSGDVSRPNEDENESKGDSGAKLILSNDSNSEDDFLGGAEDDSSIDKAQDGSKTEDETQSQSESTQVDGGSSKNESSSTHSNEETSEGVQHFIHQSAHDTSRAKDDAAEENEPIPTATGSFRQKKIPEEVEMSKKRKDSAKEDLAVRSSRPTSLKSPFAQTYKKRKTRDAKTSPRATQASKKQKFDENEKWGADAMSIDKANKQEERKEGTSKGKGVPENEAVFEDKTDSVPTTSNLILPRNDQETQANLNAEPSSSNQKWDETIKESAIMLAQGTIGANKAGTSAPVSDETAKKVGIEIVSTGSSSEPSDPTPAKAVFWHGDLVDEMFIPFLDMVYAKYPTTFNDFKCTIPALRTVILEILGHAVRKLDEQPIQNFTPKDLEGLFNTVDDLRRIGLAVDWLEAHVQFLLPLAGYASRTKDIGALRKAISEMEDQENTLSNLLQADEQKVRNGPPLSSKASTGLF